MKAIYSNKQDDAMNAYMKGKISAEEVRQDSKNIFQIISCN